MTEPTDDEQEGGMLSHDISCLEQRICNALRKKLLSPMQTKDICGQLQICRDLALFSFWHPEAIIND